MNNFHSLCNDISFMSAVPVADDLNDIIFDTACIRVNERVEKWKFGSGNDKPLQF